LSSAVAAMVVLLRQAIRQPAGLPDLALFERPPALGPGDFGKTAVHSRSQPPLDQKVM
jgi:hypothetical protein